MSIGRPAGGKGRFAPCFPFAGHNLGRTVRGFVARFRLTFAPVHAILEVVEELSSFFLSLAAPQRSE